MKQKFSEIMKGDEQVVSDNIVKCNRLNLTEFCCERFIQLCNQPTDEIRNQLKKKNEIE